MDKCNVKRNIAKNGIEIRFPEKPEWQILSEIKSRRFRYSRRQKIWYKKFSEADYQWALKFCSVHDEAKLVIKEDPNQQLIRDTTIYKNNISLALLKSEIESGKMESVIGRYQNEREEWIYYDDDTLEGEWNPAKIEDLKGDNNPRYSDGKIWNGRYLFRYKQSLPTPEQEPTITEQLSPTSEPDDLEPIDIQTELTEEDISNPAIQKWPYPSTIYGLKDFIKDKIKDDKFIISMMENDRDPIDFIDRSRGIRGVNYTELVREAPDEFYKLYVGRKNNIGTDLIYQAFNELKAERKGETYDVDHLNTSLEPKTKFDFIHIPIYQRIIDSFLVLVETVKTRPINSYFKNASNLVNEKIELVHPELISGWKYIRTLKEIKSHFQTFLFNIEHHKSNDWKNGYASNGFYNAVKYFQRLDGTITIDQLDEIGKLVLDHQNVMEVYSMRYSELDEKLSDRKEHDLIHNITGRVNLSAELTDKNGIHITGSTSEYAKPEFLNRMVHAYLRVKDYLRYFDAMWSDIESFKKNASEKDKKNELNNKIEPISTNSSPENESEIQANKDKDDINEAIKSLQFLLTLESDPSEISEINEAIDSLKLLLTL